MRIARTLDTTTEFLNYSRKQKQSFFRKMIIIYAIVTLIRKKFSSSSNTAVVIIFPGALEEFLGGDVWLRPWNPNPAPEQVKLNFSTLH